jgi:hypothetical protein
MNDAECQEVSFEVEEPESSLTFSASSAVPKA